MKEVNHDINVFIAYSREDTVYLEKLRTYLMPLHRNKTLKIWYDGEILPGSVWEDQIKDQLHKADIILLLVSANSLASDYFYDKEMSDALKRHHEKKTTVVPVILSDCAWEYTELANIQALPKDGKPIDLWNKESSAYTNIVRGVHKRIEDVKEKRKEAALALQLQEQKQQEELELQKQQEEKEKQRQLEAAQRTKAEKLRLEEQEKQQRLEAEQKAKEEKQRLEEQERHRKLDEERKAEEERQKAEVEKQEAEKQKLQKLEKEQKQMLEMKRQEEEKRNAQQKLQARKAAAREVAEKRKKTLSRIVNHKGVKIGIPALAFLILLLFAGPWIINSMRGKSINPFNSGLFLEGFRDEKNSDLWGIMNKQEVVLVKPIYEEVGRFDGKFISVKKNGKWGFLNKKGNQAIGFEFDFVSADGFKNGVAKVQKGAAWFYIDEKGNCVKNCLENKEGATKPAIQPKSEPGKGTGEIKSVNLNYPLDKTMAKNGKSIYNLKCAACHKLTDQRVVGPGWKGVTKRRKPEWIMNMIIDPSVMLENDPAAKKLLKECLTRMPSQNVTVQEARDILEFMRQNDGEI